MESANRRFGDAFEQGVYPYKRKLGVKETFMRVVMQILDGISQLTVAQRAETQSNLTQVI